MRDECLERFKKLWPPNCLKAVRNVYWGLIRVPPWLLSSLQHIEISSQKALDEILSYWAGKNKYLQSFISFILDFILTYSETWHNMGYGTLCNAKQHNHHLSYYWKYGYFCQLETEQKLCKTLKCFVAWWFMWTDVITEYWKLPCTLLLIHYFFFLSSFYLLTQKSNFHP